MTPEAPLAHAFVAAADIRIQSPEDRRQRQEKAEAAEMAAQLRGAKAERERINAIVSMPEAKYRLTTALHIALNTEWSFEQAQEYMALFGDGTA